MSTLAPFRFQDAIEVRTVADGDNVRFVLADVCACLDLSNPSMVAQRIDPDALSTAEVIDSMGRAQTARMVNEAGLYEVIFMSRKDEARVFKRWVTHEVLPAIRRTGTYAAPTEPPTHSEALRGWADAIDQLTAARETIADLAPKADAFAHFLAGDRDYSVGDSAKMLVDEGVKTGERRLFDTMNEHGWIFRREGCWHLSQRIVESGYGRMKPSAVTFMRSDGSIGTGRPQVRITARGLEALRRLHARELAVMGS